MNTGFEGVPNECLVALDLLVCKVGRRWKGLMRDLRDETDDKTWSGPRHTTFVLRLKGLSDAEIHDLSILSRKFIDKATAPAIRQEVINRKRDGRIL